MKSLCGLGWVLFLAAAQCGAASLMDDYTQEAEFALEELKKLSDSGVYTSLKLKNILDASEKEGIYHQNTMMSLELTSPYFKSGKNSEVFSIVVLTHKDDGLKSFAIDEFPEMTQESIEAFTIEKIKRKRLQREEAFRRLELESVHFLSKENLDSEL